VEGYRRFWEESERRFERLDEYLREAQRKMTCVGTPSGSSTDDRAEGLLAELEGGPDEDHRRA
jgi:hypothetical protein